MKGLSVMCLKQLQSPILGLLTCVCMAAVSSIAQPAKGANKFLGNITTNGQVRSDFMKYWNQITAENEHKWASIEGTRGSMNFSGGDRVVNFAKEQGILWKFHTLVWGSQYPSWMNQLNSTQQLAEIEEWYDAVKKKYPDIPMIDVVNEAQPGHAEPPFKNALGGSGASGHDWIVEAFKMARERWPKAILIYNDYNNCEYSNDVNWTYNMVKAIMQAGAPIDAIGCQAHDAYKLSTATVKANIDKLASLGLPIFITEYDIGEADDNKQKKIMEEQFTMFWNHPKIVGVTYWGYVNGSTWRDNTGLMQSNGNERPALTWLKEYVKNNPNPPNDFPGFIDGQSSGYRLAVSTKGQGTVTRTPDSTSYSENTEVTLSATPAEGWVFSGWSGDASGNQNPLKVKISAATNITAKFVTEDGSEDLITNGTFEAGSDSWTFNSWGGEGSGEVVNGEYKLTVATIGENYYDLQVVQPGIHLEKGKTYRVVFDAYASENRVLNINVGMPVDPYTTFLSKVINGANEVNLTTTKKTCSFDFIMEEESYEDSRIEFSVGLFTPTVYIDNVSLYEIKTVAARIPVKNKVARKIDIRQNGSSVNISFNTAGDNNASINIYDLQGNVIRSSKFKSQSGTFSFNTAGISKGYYIFKISSGNFSQKTGLVISGK